MHTNYYLQNALNGKAKQLLIIMVKAWGIAIPDISSIKKKEQKLRLIFHFALSKDY